MLKQINEIKLIIGMTKNDVNKLVGHIVLFKDDVYLGSTHLHKWKCKCGDEFDRKFINMKSSDSYRCKRCVLLEKRDKIEEKYINKIKSKIGFEYIGIVFGGEKLSNGYVADEIYLRVLHKYCGTIYETRAEQFIRVIKNCPHCCGVYEKSFAYHIEIELGLNINDIWDFNKNTVSPYYIHKNNNTDKVWIKCREKDYHGSYRTNCILFTQGFGCNFCKPHHKDNVSHLYDSFGYHNFDKVMSWHPDNDISPFKVSNKASRKIKFTCFECGIDFHRRIYEITNLGMFCPECSMSEGERIIYEYLKYNSIEYEYEKEFDKLTGLGGGNLSYDFYLPYHNILIEFQGDQHRRFVKMFHKSHRDFEKQQEHDRRKREYAGNNGIRLLELWEEDKVNIEEILNKTLNIVNV